MEEWAARRGGEGAAGGGEGRVEVGGSDLLGFKEFLCQAAMQESGEAVGPAAGGSAARRQWRRRGRGWLARQAGGRSKGVAWWWGRSDRRRSDRQSDTW